MWTNRYLTIANFKYNSWSYIFCYSKSVWHLRAQNISVSLQIKKKKKRKTIYQRGYIELRAIQETFRMSLYLTQVKILFQENLSRWFHLIIFFTACNNIAKNIASVCHFKNLALKLFLFWSRDVSIYFGEAIPNIGFIPVNWSRDRSGNSPKINIYTF